MLSFHYKFSCAQSLLSEATLFIIKMAEEDQPRHIIGRPIERVVTGGNGVKERKDASGFLD